MAESSGSIQPEVDAEPYTARAKDIPGSGVRYEHEVLTFLSEKVAQIFEEHLDGWYRVPEAWPAVRDMKTFQQWFEYSIHSQVVDLCDYLIEYEEL